MAVGMVAAAIRRRGNEPLHTIEEILCLCIYMYLTVQTKVNDNKRTR
jgi:hypothetical protein